MEDGEELRRHGSQELRRLLHVQGLDLLAVFAALAAEPQALAQASHGVRGGLPALYSKLSPPRCLTLIGREGRCSTRTTSWSRSTFRRTSHGDRPPSTSWLCPKN